MKLSDSAKSTPTVSESCEKTSQMSLFGGTCGDLPLEMSALLWTPTSKGNQDAPSMAARDPGSWFRSSPQGIPASHSHSPGSDWARRMTATYGRKFGAYWLSSDPPDSWVRTLLGTSIWGSTTCYLTWKRSATPAGRLLFRLVPSTPRTAGIGSGLWPTPDTPSGGRSMPPGTTPTGMTPDGKKVTVGLANAAKMWPTPTEDGNYNRKGASATSGDGLATAVGVQPNLKLNSAWVSRMMGYPDDWLTLDGEETP